MRVNRVKRKIKAGQKTYGVSFTFKSLPLVDVVGNLGFDYIFIEASCAGRRRLRHGADRGCGRMSSGHLPL